LSFQLSTLNPIPPTDLLFKASGSFALKIFSSLLGFSTSLLLARLLGASGFGAYAYAMAWIGLFSLPATLGLDRLLVRETAVYTVRADWPHLCGLLRFTNQAVLLASFILMPLAAFAGLIVMKKSMFYIVLLALPIIPMTTLTLTRQSALRGLSHIIPGQLPAMLIRPLCLIILIAGWPVWSQKDLTPEIAIALNLGAAVIAFGVSVFLLNKMLPAPVHKSSPEIMARQWLKSAMPLLLVIGMFSINAQVGTVMLGSIFSEDAAGIYSVASGSAGFIFFSLMAMNTALAPVIAKLHATRDLVKFQQTVTKGVRLALLVSLPVAFVLTIFGDSFLLLFGPEFVQGRLALSILVLGQLINVAVGPVGMLLNMTGHERDTAKGVGVSTLINVALNALLIPIWGINGAAVATAISIITWNALLAYRVVKQLGLHPSIVGQIRPLGKI